MVGASFRQSKARCRDSRYMNKSSQYFKLVVKNFDYKIVIALLAKSGEKRGGRGLGSYKFLQFLNLPQRPK